MDSFCAGAMCAPFAMGQAGSPVNGSSRWLECQSNKLKFEYEKRQRNISTLQMKASSLTRDYEQSERECDEYQEERQSHGERHPDLIGYDYRNRLISEMGSCQSQITEMESEMSAIERVMESNGK